MFTYCTCIYTWSFVIIRNGTTKKTTSGNKCGTIRGKLNSTISEHFVRSFTREAENPPPAEPNTPKVTLFKDFKLVGPPEFKGTNELIIAQTWITEIEKVFKVTKVNDEQKIDFATFFLKEEANHWWEANKNRVGLGIISWDRFKEIFFENYFQISYGSIIFLGLHHIRWIPKLERLEGSKRD